MQNGDMRDMTRVEREALRVALSQLRIDRLRSRALRLIRQERHIDRNDLRKFHRRTLLRTARSAVEGERPEPMTADVMFARHGPERRFRV